MRKSAPVDLSGSTATVRELTVANVLVIAEMIGGEIQWPQLHLDRALLLRILALADECVDLPGGAALDTLSLSELQAVIDTWMGLHTDFFAWAAGLIAAVPRSTAQTSRAASNAPASSSASADSSTPGTGAGDSSTAPSPC